MEKELDNFKLPSVVKDEVKQQAQANGTVVVEARTPCCVKGNYYVGGTKFHVDKGVADEFVKAGMATIVEN